MPKLTTASKAGQKLTVKKAAPAVTQATTPGALLRQTHIEIGYRLSGASGDFRATTTGGAPPLPIGPGRVPGDWPTSAYAGKIQLVEHGIEAEVVLLFKPIAG